MKAVVTTRYGPPDVLESREAGKSPPRHNEVADRVKPLWRGEFDNQELNALHAEAFAHAILEIDWTRQVKAHSLGWVTARDADELVGFVNVAWDGEIHAFILDAIVSASRRRHGIGRRLIAVAAAEARAAGCEWLHVDFDEEHRPFYLDACGFAPTPAGLMAL